MWNEGSTELLSGIIQELKNDARAVEAYGGNYYTPIGSFSYDGEKNPGEIGSIKKFEVRYNLLSLRSWQNFLESDVSQAVIRKYVRWIVGTGLTLQSEPVANLISQMGVDFDKKRFVDLVEPRFRLFAKSKRASYSKQMTLNKIMEEAQKNAVVSGDVLVILRTDTSSNMTVELIDGEMVQTPIIGGGDKKDGKRGYKVRYGVVYDAFTKEHKAYYVRQTNGDYKRVECRNGNGQIQAFLYYGLRYRLDSIRGIPLISACLQTIKQLDRYKEATVGSAEERQKIVYYVKHDSDGSGESIQTRRLQQALMGGLNKDLSTNTGYTTEQLETLIATTTQKQAVDLPKGADLKSLASQNELSFGPFMKENLIIMCATLQIPYEVAISKYENTFSSSRAALKDWEHTLYVERNEMGENFCTPIYKYWLNIMVMSGKINEPAIERAILSNDLELYDAITNSRWTGRNVPHIDPVKEVEAERRKLGSAGANIPLTTPSQSTELLGTGEFDENVVRFVEQLSQIPDEIKSLNNGQSIVEDDKLT